MSNWHCESIVERKWELSRKQILAWQNRSRNESYDESFGFVKINDLALIEDHLMDTDPDFTLESESELKEMKRYMYQVTYDYLPYNYQHV